MKRFALIGVVLSLGCGSSEDSTSTAVTDSAAGGDDVALSDDTAIPTTDTATGSDTATTTDTGTDPFGAYPAGPYGNKVGDVVANLTWEGYVNPLSDALSNTKPYVTTSMDKLRRDAKKGYALIHVSEFY